MKTLFVALVAWLTSSQAFADPYVDAVNQVLHANEEMVVEACIDYTGDLTTLIAPEELKGEAAVKYQEVLTERELGPTQNPLDYGVAAATLKLENHTVQMVINIIDGNGYCRYYTKLGSYVNRVSGTESSEWILRDN